MDCLSGLARKLASCEFSIIHAICSLTGRVCSVHFVASDYTLRQILMNDWTCKSRLLKPNAIPSLLLPDDNHHSSRNEPPKIDDNDHHLSCIEPPKIENNAHRSSRIEPPKIDDNDHHSSCIEPPKIENNAHRSSRIEPPKIDDNDHHSSCIEPPEIDDNADTSTSIKPPKRLSGWDPLTCRACLVTDVKLFNLHQIGLADLFGYLSKTAVAPSDGLPQYVCFYCRTQLCKLRDFQYKCQKSLKYFKENALRDPSDFCIPLTKTRSLTLDYVPEDITANDNFNNSNNIINVKNELKDLIDFNDDRRTDETSLSCDEENYVTLEENVKSEIINETDIFEPLKELKRLDFNDVDDNRKTNGVFLSCDTHHEGNNVTLVLKKGEDVLIDTKYVEDCLIVKSREVKKKTDTKNKQTAEKKSKEKRQKYNEKFFEEFSKIHNVKVVCLSKDEQIRRVQERKESQEYRDSRFSCDVCYKGFMSETAHKRHMKSHDPNSGAYVCEVCHMRYPTQSTLNTHARLHRMLFVCALCHQVNFNATRAKLHSRWHKGIKFPCKTCHKEFNAHTTYHNHVRGVHKPVTCAHCRQTLVGTYALCRHVRTHKQEVQSPSGDASICELCGAVFSSDRRLLQHYHNTHKRRKDRSPSEYLCDQCAKSFPYLFQLKTHLRTHTGERPYPCPMCPKSFRTKVTLEVHINVHTGDRPYKCPQCPETFKSYAQRYKHKLMVHLRERRYKCSICDKSYVVAYHLKEHIRFVHLNQPRPPRRNRRRKQCGDNLAKKYLSEPLDGAVTSYADNLI